MSKRLRILHLEDDPDYSALVRDLLHKEGMEVELVTAATREAFEAVLGNGGFDLILADYLLPSYNGLQALERAKEVCPRTPFLLVSGTIGEQAAIESLRAGATDYVLKQWPERLVPAVRRAAQENEERAKRKQAETELTRREKYFRTLTENALDVLSILNRDGFFLYNSPSAKSVLGYAPQQLAGQSAFAYVHAEDLPQVLEAFQFGLANPHLTVTLAFRYRHGDGAWRHVEAVGQNRLDDPDVAGIVINLRDISDRKRAEDSLRESEKEYRLIFQGNPNPMWVFDLETLAFLEVNEAAIQHYGYSREEFLSLTLKDIRVAEELPQLLDYHAKLLRREILSDLDQGCIWLHRKKDGTIVDVEVKWSPISFRGCRAALTLANDVTERRRAEYRNAAFAKLGQSLSSARTPTEAGQIIRNISAELFAWDRFSLDLNATDRDLMHPLLKVDTIDGRRIEVPGSASFRPPDALARRIMERGAELILREPPGPDSPGAGPFDDSSRASRSLMLAPIRNRSRVIGLLSIQSFSPKAYTDRDLETLQVLADHSGGALERIRAEHALRESEQRIRDLFESSPDAVIVGDLDGNILDLNPAACQLHRVAREELVGKNIFELAPAARREQAARKFRRLVEGGIRRVESESVAADGHTTPVEIHASRIQYGATPALLLHVRDITERKHAESALSSSELLFHSVWENSVDGMRLTDEQGMIVAANEAYCRLVGLDRHQLKDKPFTVIYAGSEDREKILATYRERFQSRVIERQAERTLTLHNGNLVVLEDTSSFVELRGKPPLLLGLFRDVTAQKRLEDQLRQAQKMEAIGQLAGGVAHDFNNILTVIHGHASLLIAAGGLDGQAAKSAQQIGQAAERAAGLTRQLLTFSRRQVMQPRRLDLNEVVGNMTKMLGRILGEDITLQVNCWPQPPLVEADAGMMEQVLLNLAVNSRDAMPKGGQLTIRISVREVDERHVRHHPEARPGRFVCVTAADTGCGIAPGNLRRIFEPFFTTKEVGKGTGLGLATVYGVIKQHQGWVEVESEVGKGTAFRVYLPGTAKPAEKGGEQSLPVVVRGGAETILVVEDEHPVRELVCSVLHGHGYRILQAESGVQALDVWREHQGRIDLMLTDLVMPDRINGRELAEQLWAERPELKVIFTSGYSADVVGKEFVLQSGLHYLQKPYHPQKLALAVRECLDGGRSNGERN